MDNHEEKFQSMINDLVNEGKTRKAAEYNEAREQAPDRVKYMIGKIIDLMDDDKPIDTESAFLWTAMTVVMAKMSSELGVPREAVIQALDEAWNM